MRSSTPVCGPGPSSNFRLAASFGSSIVISHSCLAPPLCAGALCCLLLVVCVGYTSARSGENLRVHPESAPAQIVILNGAPRAGKSSIVAVIQDTFDGVWMNLGVDLFARNVTPRRYQPGIGLRPGPGPRKGGDKPELEPLVPVMYAALYESIAAHSRLGLNVVVDVGHHGAIHPGVLGDCARRLTGLPALFVGVRCPIEDIMRRREEAGPSRYTLGTPEEPVPPPVLLWQDEVHKPGLYDLEVDTSKLSPQDCAELIRRRLRDGPPGTAFERLAREG
jgi:chloramphenicol 3-O phosphotransferase